MADHEFVTRLEQLEQELPLWDRAACLPLLGLLERLKVQVWAKILGSPLDPADGREPDRLLTLPEVAERLAIPTGHAYELARRDVLPVVRFGKYVRVSQVSLTRWMGQQTTPQRRIDNGPLGFHSGTVTLHRQTRRPAKARPKPGPTQRARTRAVRVQSQSEPNRLSQVKPAVEGVTANDLISEGPE
jgi:excisionase family DNA binding protein